MLRHPVDSSSLRSVGYDAADSILEVEFHTGRIYQYSDVSPELHQALMAAESHGTFFNENVKYGGYSYRRVRR